MGPLVGISIGALKSICFAPWNQQQVHLWKLMVARLSPFLLGEKLFFIGKLIVLGYLYNFKPQGPYFLCVFSTQIFGRKNSLLFLCCIPWLFVPKHLFFVFSFSQFQPNETKGKDLPNKNSSMPDPPKRLPSRFLPVVPGRYATGTWFQDWVAMCWHGVMPKVKWDKAPIYYVGGCVCGWDAIVYR